MGGSTTFKTTLGDEFTIPSYLYVYGRIPLKHEVSQGPKLKNLKEEMEVWHYKCSF